MKITLFLSLLLFLTSVSTYARHYVGGDISLLPQYENAGAQYKDHDGTPVDDLLPWLYRQGMNAMRVRLFVDPDAYKGSDKDPNACQSLEYITPLCNDIVNAGFDLMLDFHYSDTWADPAAQFTPEAWKNLSDDELVQKIYDYTRTSLLTLRQHGVTPKFIQTGNEISYGMLWGAIGTPEGDLKKTYINNAANWQRLGRLLKSAISACREVCPDAQIVIHTERVADLPVLQNFYDMMRSMDVDYDIIGLSYYPYFHGDMYILDRALNLLENLYPQKQIMIVETGYSYKWEVPGTTVNLTGKYPYTDAGQDAFARDLVQTLEAHPNVDGLFWWWMEYNAYGTSLSGWYNAPLFDSITGRATSALKTICSFADGNAVTETPDDTSEELWYDLSGRRIAHPDGAICIDNHGRKVMK